MLIMQYDPTTTELILREQDIPPVIANISQLKLTTDLTLYQGTVIVHGLVDLAVDGSLEISVDSVLEVVS